GRLSAAGDHVDVAGARVLVAVDRRDHGRPDRSRRQVDGPDAGLGVAGRVLAVDVGTGRLEDEVRQLVLLEQPVDALVAGLESLVTGPTEPGTVRVDTDHPARLDHLTAE